MDQYVTGGAIRALREKAALTQAALGERIGVSDKTVSKWETGKGYPDITLLEPLAAALGVCVAELLSGAPVENRNRAANMNRVRFAVCPVCGNVIVSAGDAVVCCHGITLVPLSPEEPDDAHGIRTEPIEDERYVTLDHPMTKSHHISFLAATADNAVNIVKLYPEGPAEARFPRRTEALFAYCNRHGLFRIKL